ncbi:MAG: glucosaminidase domain-containing protein [Paludibacteraceae bacterium]|nr:glucosaminidase domain-containing protein [Paludibacteraceae bacterium]
MRKVLLYIILACTAMTLRAQDAAQKPVLNTTYLQYIEQYKKIAIEQEKTHKIPACITLAQGLLESGAGMSELATKANNHFGIKCHKDWTGETYSHDDETAAECFRKYRRAKDSYEDHSLFLMRPRYASLFELPISDYKGWAHGLRRCGYATDPTYAAKLIKLIEDYGLTSLETAELPKEQVAPTTKQPVVEDSEQTQDNVITQTLGKDKKVSATMGELSLFTEHEVYSEKMVRWVIAELGDTYETIGYEFNIEVSRLRRYNNAEGRKQPEIGDKVYLTRHK